MVACDDLFKIVSIVVRPIASPAREIVGVSVNLTDHLARVRSNKRPVKFVRVSLTGHSHCLRHETFQSIAMSGPRSEIGARYAPNIRAWPS